LGDSFYVVDNGSAQCIGNLMEKHKVKKIITALFILVFTPPLFAVTGPSVVLKTTALSNPYPTTFLVNVTFSEPVIGFGPTVLNVTNGTVVNVTGTDCQPNFVVEIQPLATGKVTVLIPANAVASLNTGALNQASNTLSLAGLNPNVPPGSNFNFKQWSLTLPLPLGSTHNAITIGPTTLSGTPGLNNGYTNSPYFFTDPVTGAMNLFSPLNGATTSGSDFARCEFLEVLLGASPTWKLSTFASNTMTASLLVSQTPPVQKRVVIGQIHDKGDTDKYGHSASNSPFIKLFYDTSLLDPNNQPCNGCVYAQIRVTPAQSNFLPYVRLLQNIPLNTIFMYKITLLRDGTLTLRANNVSVTMKVNTSIDNTIGWGAQNLYFKAGVYNLENGSSNVLGGAASFNSLQVTHT